jgi:hypothetical protein
MTTSQEKIHVVFVEEDPWFRETLWLLKDEFAALGLIIIAIFAAAEARGASITGFSEERTNVEESHALETVDVVVIAHNIRNRLKAADLVKGLLHIRPSLKIVGVSFDGSKLLRALMNLGKIYTPPEKFVETIHTSLMGRLPNAVTIYSETPPQSSLLPAGEESPGFANRTSVLQESD